VHLPYRERRVSAGDEQKDRCVVEAPQEPAVVGPSERRLHPEQTMMLTFSAPPRRAAARPRFTMLCLHQMFARACDILRPVYEESRGEDGFVSLEVSPWLADDTEGSIAEARRFWAAVDRPNLFIKIPGTAAGVPAIEELLFDGINLT